MIDLGKLLDMTGELIGLAIAIGTIVARFNLIQKEIDHLKYRVDTHCLRIRHLGEFLADSSNYQPIDKD